MLSEISPSRETIAIWVVLGIVALVAVILIVKAGIEAFTEAVEDAPAQVGIFILVVVAIVLFVLGYHGLV